jgi:hypothetical protein
VLEPMEVVPRTNLPMTLRIYLTPYTNFKNSKRKMATIFGAFTVNWPILMRDSTPTLLNWTD